MPDEDTSSEVGRYIEAAGHATNIHDKGNGVPLVLLHGSGPGVSAWSNWGSVIDPLAERFRVVAPDLAGFGHTERVPGQSYNIKVWVQHLIGVLDALEIERAVLVGNSFGGGLALAAALSQRNRVGSMVLMGTPAGDFTMTEGLRAGWFYEPSVAEMRRILELFPHDPSIVTDEMVRRRYEASARPGSQEAFRALIPEPGAEGATVRGVPEDRLATIDVPALVLHGREDRVIPVELGHRLNRCLEHSDLHVFGQCGHWVQIERRNDFLRLVADFAADSSGTWS